MTDTEMLDWLQEFGVSILQDTSEKFILEYMDKNGFPHRSDRYDTLRECILSVNKEN